MSDETAAAVVFAGPTLAGVPGAVAVPFVLLPPARQGDVFRAVERFRPAAIGLIDGLFLDVPAVWHRELLWALSRGVYVYGAASMGALRAAELHDFGMSGVGRIYTAYRDGAWAGFPERFEDDDEVAVLHAPAEAGGAPLCDAMVDIRATLLAAEAGGVIDRATCLSMATRMKRLHFSQRSFTALARGAGAKLRAWLPGGRVPQKQIDALALLTAMRAAQPSWAEPFRATFRFERALVWERFKAAADAAALADRAAALERLRGRVSLRQEDVDAWLG